LEPIAESEAGEEKQRRARYYRLLGGDDGEDLRKLLGGLRRDEILLEAEDTAGPMGEGR